jgi:hypothetical protein
MYTQLIPSNIQFDYSGDTKDYSLGKEQCISEVCCHETRRVGVGGVCWRVVLLLLRHCVSVIQFGSVCNQFCFASSFFFFFFPSFSFLFKDSDFQFRSSVNLGRFNQSLPPSHVGGWTGDITNKQGDLNFWRKWRENGLLIIGRLVHKNIQLVD